MPLRPLAAEDATLRDPISATRSGACGGCGGDNPCPACGLSNEDPDHWQATWARIVADARRAPSLFWDTMLAADAFFGPSGISASRSLVARRVAEAQTIISALSEDTGRIGFQTAWPMRTQSRASQGNGLIDAPASGKLLFAPLDAPAPAPRGGPASTDLEDFKRLLRTATGPDGTTYDPGDGPDVPGNLQCKVQEWHYPLFWAPRPDEGAKPPPGFFYCAEVIFVNDVVHGYDCNCCVLRQFLKKASSTSINSDYEEENYRLDTGVKGGRTVQYGGARKDGSGPKSPDSMDNEVAVYSKDGCKVYWQDAPREGGHLSGDFELTYSFIAVVYDRCKHWVIRDAREMMLWSKGTIENDRIEYDDSAAARDVPPQDPKTGWSHHRRPVTETAKTRKQSLPGTQVPPTVSDPNARPSSTSIGRAQEDCDAERAKVAG